MSEQQPAGGPPALRVFALVAVCVGVAALAAAAFIFSYAGIHVVVLQAGVNSRLAKGYPLILDVLLVVILAAMLALRGAGWPSKLLAWVSLLALLAAAAGADAMHAAGDRLPMRAAEITVAVLPWALVLIAFVLLLSMLRQARVRRQAQVSEQARPPKWQPPQPPPLSRQALVPGFPATEAPTAQLPTPQEPAADTTAADTTAADTQTTPVPVVAADIPTAHEPPAAEEPPAEEPPVPAPAGKPNDTWRLAVPRQVTPETVEGAVSEPAMAAIAPDGALDAELSPDDPGGAGAAPGLAEDHFEPDEDPATVATADEADPDEDEADTDERDMGEPDAGEPDGDEDVQTADMEMPVFHRMWSSPVPPSEDAG